MRVVNMMRGVEISAIANWTKSECRVTRRPEHVSAPHFAFCHCAPEKKKSTLFSTIDKTQNCEKITTRPGLKTGVHRK